MRKKNGESKRIGQKAGLKPTELWICWFARSAQHVNIEAGGAGAARGEGHARTRLEHGPSSDAGREFFYLSLGRDSGMAASRFE